MIIHMQESRVAIQDRLLLLISKDYEATVNSAAEVARRATKAKLYADRLKSVLASKCISGVAGLHL